MTGRVVDRTGSSRVARIVRGTTRGWAHLSSMTKRFTHGEPVGTIALLGCTVELSDVLVALRMLARMDEAEAPSILQLERMFADYVGAPYAYSFLGGRVALSAILEAMDIGAGDEVILPGFTCVAVPNALLFRGIRPVYADIDPDTFNILPAAIGHHVSRRTRAVIIQHTFGLVADLAPLLAAADHHGVPVIEDCAHALGARYRGQKVGTFGGAAFFSTEQSKPISTQMGGMAVTSDPSLARRLASIQDRAPFPSTAEIRERLGEFVAQYVYSRPQWNEVLGLAFHTLAKRYMQPNGTVASTTPEEIHSLRPTDYGKRLPAPLARLGIRQLTHVDRYNARRAATARVYDQLLASVGAKRVAIAAGTSPSVLRYPVFVRDKEAFAEIASRVGIQPGLWYTDNIHPRGTDLQRLQYERGQCPFAERAARGVANLPTGYVLPHMTLERFQLLRDVLVKESEGGS